MSPFQSACIAHAHADGLAANVTFNGKPLWQDYEKETAAILAAFLAAVTPTNDTERSFLDALKLKGQQA